MKPDVAGFEAIHPNLNVQELVARVPSFRFADRYDASEVLADREKFEKLVHEYIFKRGEPVVIQGLQNKLPLWLFSTTWLETNFPGQEVQIRDLMTGTDQGWTLPYYLGGLAVLAAHHIRRDDPQKSQRMYLKDMDVPDQWHKILESIIPPSVYYMNEGTGDYGGPGSVQESQQGVWRPGRGVAPSGDLMSSLPPEQRAVNMMCYIGHEGTYTPAHREMCGSLGQNIMVETSTNVDAHGRKTTPGSSLWFMTKYSERELVSEYWMSALGHDIEVESHFGSLNSWVKAPFTTYVVEQKWGDFILIPPMSPHQVWNRGSRTMKAAWNRTTVETLEIAMAEALPRARLVCRDEQYKNKSIIYYTLEKYNGLLERVGVVKRQSFDMQTAEAIRQSKQIDRLKKDFIRLFKLFNNIMLSESFSQDFPTPKVQMLPYDSCVTCSYCRCNIFNRFLTCKKCASPEDDPEGLDVYDVCMDCYTMGRSCWCIGRQKWVEQWPWGDLLKKHEKWRGMANFMRRKRDPEYPALDEAQKQLGKKTLAAVCQEQISIRWKAWKKDPEAEQPLPPEENKDPQVGNDGYAKRRKPRKSGIVDDTLNCHVCKIRHESWKVAKCACGKAYCYGNLYRAFDLMPIDVMEQTEWKCPVCLGYCSCGQCRKDGKTTPYQPKKTFLGHDTKKVADPRSVESLVDFSRSNTTWLKLSDDDPTEETARIRKAREQAANLEAGIHGEHDSDTNLTDAPYEPDDGGQTYGIPLDPAFRDDEANRRISHSHALHPYQHAVSNLSPTRDGRSRSHDHLMSEDPFAHSSPTKAPRVRQYESPDAARPSPYYHNNGGRVSFVPPNQHTEFPTLEDPRVLEQFQLEVARLPSQPGQAHDGCVAPAATMISGYYDREAQGAPLHSSPDPMRRKKGSPYEYPTGAYGEFCNEDDSLYRPSNDVKMSVSNSKKRKFNQVDSMYPNGMGANLDYERIQQKQLLEEAKKNDMLTATKARLDNMSKVVQLPINWEKLPQYAQTPEDPLLQFSSFGYDGVRDERDDSMITSDLAQKQNGTKALPPGTIDFKPINKNSRFIQNQKPENATPSGRKRGRPRGSVLLKAREVDAEAITPDPSTTSEISGELSTSKVDGNQLVIKKPRASAWLARKNQEDPVDLPSELAPLQRKRRPKKPTETSELSPNAQPSPSVEYDDNGGGRMEKERSAKNPSAELSGSGSTTKGGPHFAKKPDMERNNQDRRGKTDLQSVRKISNEDKVAKANREAKLNLSRMIEGEISDLPSDSNPGSDNDTDAASDRESSGSEDRQVIKKAAPPLRSMFQGKKKVKIVSIKDLERRKTSQSVTKSAAKSPASKTVTSKPPAVESSTMRKSVVVDLCGSDEGSGSKSDDDSDDSVDEIPARRHDVYFK